MCKFSITSYVADTVNECANLLLILLQIDTLLRDMTIDTPPDHTPTDRSETLSSWLSKHGLSGCTSALESHGFDSLMFLGGNILVMDDLEDIGISTQDDQ